MYAWWKVQKDIYTSHIIMSYSLCCIPNSIESGSDDQDNLGHLGYFWWVKWVLSANKIIWMWPGYRMFFRKHLLSEWTLGLMNALKYLWHEPAYFYLNLFWNMWCLKISSSRSPCKVLVLYPAKNKEIYDIVPFQNFFVSFYIIAGYF